MDGPEPDGSAIQAAESIQSVGALFHFEQISKIGGTDPH